MDRVVTNMHAKVQVGFKLNWIRKFHRVNGEDPTLGPSIDGSPAFAQNSGAKLKVETR